MEPGLYTHMADNEIFLKWPIWGTEPRESCWVWKLGFVSILQGKDNEGVSSSP